ncbi:MAG TPA: VIT1/CCC1 family protein [Kineosporiaceae bacterium]|nr:VIT1/CCC1 family protein [Kineosporiaceae bacterium]
MTTSEGPGDGGGDGRMVRPNRAQVRRWRDLLASEREAATLYDTLAGSAAGERAEILRELAQVERRHAAHWEEQLRSAGEPVPPPQGPGLRTRLLTTTARRLSLDAVLPMIERAETSDAGLYDADPDAAAGMAEDERGHARALAAMRAGGARAVAVDPRSKIARRERWHRGDRSGALRAAIFGVSDGLVSNTSLVMGFAGSGASRSTVLLAGVAGLLAGSFSMAAGEYVSMAGQREMFEREIALERSELEEKPEEEFEELVLIYRAKGLPTAQAREIAARIMGDREVALDTLAREELGLDPDALGSPWSAALSSFVAFALGAVVVVLPYLVTGGRAAFVAALALALAAMAAVGAAIGVLNGRSPVRGAVRQVAVGALAAGVTYGVGSLIGIRTG